MFKPHHPAPVCREAPSARFRPQVLHFACQRRRGFTLIEMLVVVVIIAILASITAVAVNSAKEKARQTDCMSNLRQLGTAIVTYRADNRGRNPGWLSNLYPTYIDDKRVYICRSDKARGLGDCRPGVTEISGQDDVFDNRNNSLRLSSSQVPMVANDAIEACSYFYEFSAAPSPWATEDLDGDGFKTWCDFKENQLAKGDKNNDFLPYSSSRMPIVRCYHHSKSGKIRGYANEDASNPTLEPITLNVAYAGNVIISPLWWEGALEPGEE